MGQKAKEDFLTAVHALDQHHTSMMMDAALWNYHPNLAELAAEPITRQNAVVLGYLYCFGVGGVEKNRGTSRMWLERAAELGSPWAKSQLGHVLLRLLEVWSDQIRLDPARTYASNGAKKAYRLVKEAADAGCSAACHDVFKRMMLGIGVRVNLHIAARYAVYDVGSMMGQIALLKNKHGELAVAPLGVWDGAADIQKYLVPLAIHRQQRMWMLVAKRIKLDKHIARLIAAYVCTHPVYTYSI